MSHTLLQVECLVTMHLAGRGPVRRALESLVNRGAVTMEEARRVWGVTFGGSLIAVPVQTIEVSQ